VKLESMSRRAAVSGKETACSRGGSGDSGKVRYMITQKYDTTEIRRGRQRGEV
jgi:hypothetical protein